MRKFDYQENKIITELIRNPRLSDNQVSKLTSVPVKTVNRKRKKLEEEGILNYMLSIDHSDYGTGQMPASQLVMVELKEGITRKQFLDSAPGVMSKKVHLKHILASLLGERDGKLTLMMLINSRKKDDLLEIYNAEFVPQLKQVFGQNAIKNTTVIDMVMPLRVLHNYMPMFNMKNGIIKRDWSKDKIFVEL